MTIPPARAVAPRATERLITVSELDSLARGSFPVSLSLRTIRKQLTLLIPGLHFAEQDTVHCVSHRVPVEREHARVTVHSMESLVSERSTAYHGHQT